MVKSYAMTAQDAAKRTYNAEHYQALSAECFFIGTEYGFDTIWRDDCARWSAIARVKMGIVEKDYDYA